MLGMVEWKEDADDEDEEFERLFPKGTRFTYDEIELALSIVEEELEGLEYENQRPYLEQKRRLLLKRLGAKALESNEFSKAIRTYKILNDTHALRSAGYIAIEQGYPGSAVMAFQHLNDEEGIEKAVHAAMLVPEERRRAELMCIVDFTLDDALALDMQEIKEATKGKAHKGFHSQGTILSVINAAYQLKDSYDVAVGVANGGIPISYVFSVAGWDIVMAKACYEKNGHPEQGEKSAPEASYAWLDDSGKVRGKRVLILDDFFTTGKTLTRAIHEVRSCSPQTVGVCLERYRSEMQKVLEVKKGYPWSIASSGRDAALYDAESFVCGPEFPERFISFRDALKKRRRICISRLIYSLKKEVR